MRRLRAVVGRSWKGMIVGGLLGAPIAVYIRTFGTKISDAHNVWAEMGSAMSGIYGPILAVLTFFVLIMQVQLQKQTNKHTFDQAYLQNARADIEFYLTRLAEALDKPSKDHSTPRSVLDKSFGHVKIEQLLGTELSNAASWLDHQVPQLESMWSAIYSIFAGLSSNSEFQYDLQFVSAKQKAVAMLSYRVCVELEHYLYCRTGGRTRYPYTFSPYLSQREQ